MTEFPDTDAVHKIVTAFESRDLPHDAWTHRAHLTVAAWYVMWHGPDLALERVRDGIQRLNAAHGVPQTPTRGYHETLTHFYIWLVARAVARAGITSPLAQIVNRVIDECTDRDLPLAYYSRERLSSWEARTGWLEPDLAPLDGGPP
jgi:hypothetical protein